MERRLRYKRLRPQKWGVEIGEWEMRARNQPLTLARQREQGRSGAAAFARKSRVTLSRSLFSLSPSCPICQVGMKRPALTGLQRTVQI